MPDRRHFLQRSALAAGALVLPDVPRLNADSPANHEPARFASPAGPDLPLLPNVDQDVLLAQVRRVATAAQAVGIPLGALQAAAGPDAVQRVLDRSCLVGVHINPEMRVKVAPGPARPMLMQREWRTFLVKVRNEAGTTAALCATSARASHGWLELRMYDDPPMAACLSGLELEYRIVRLSSHEAGWREASLAFDVGQGTQDLGFRNEVPILFHCLPACLPGQTSASLTQPGPDR